MQECCKHGQISIEICPCLQHSCIGWLVWSRSWIWLLGFFQGYLLKFNFPWSSFMKYNAPKVWPLLISPHFAELNLISLNNGFSLWHKLSRLSSRDTITQSLSPMATVEAQDKLRVLGVTLDGSLSSDSHASEILKNCHYHLRPVQRIRSSLTSEVSNMIVCSIVVACIDYCNSNSPGPVKKTWTSCSTYRTEQLLASFVVASHHHVTYLLCLTGFRSANESITSSSHCVSECINCYNLHIYLRLYKYIYHSIPFAQLPKNCWSCHHTRLY